MYVDVNALRIDARLLDDASMRSATLRRDGDGWTVIMRSDWDRELCDEIRRSGAIKEASILVSTDEGDLFGVGRVEFAADGVKRGAVEVRVVGAGTLRTSL